MYLAVRGLHSITLPPSAPRPPRRYRRRLLGLRRVALELRVGANSPSLWPTMFSVMYTGMNFLPLCTAKVWPTISGTTVDRRDQVLITRFSPPRFMISTFSSKGTSTKGPFFSDLPILILCQLAFFRGVREADSRLNDRSLLLPPLHDEPIGLAVRVL